MRYRDRIDAGRRLAEALIERGYSGDDPPLVLGVARGGVPVAAEIALAMGGELDVAVARKIGAPGNPEFAIGALAGSGEPLLNEGLITAYGIPESYVRTTVGRARDEIERRRAAYRGGEASADPAGRFVIVVDDGVATGSTLIAVLRSVSSRKPARLVCAVPVGPPETVALLERECDEVVCPMQPPHFLAVGAWYDDFGQLSDEDVTAVLGGS